MASVSSPAVLVVGATGATGRRLVRELLARDCSVRVVVRSADRIPDDVRDRARLEIVEGNLLDFEDDTLRELVADRDALASCLGHNLSARGIWGRPRRLVTDATRRLCLAAEKTRPNARTRFVLMNSSGVRNRDLDERVSFPQRIVIGLLRALIPPHADNEQAADVLRVEIGASHPTIEWCAVRPDGLTESETVTPIEVHPSPIRSAIFDAGKISRINVAHFMADLITNDATWSEWRDRMPVLYDAQA